MNTGPSSPAEPVPGGRRKVALSVLLDVVIATVIGGLAVRSVWPCVPNVMVAADAFVPIECGWRWTTTGSLTHPSQPIYGYGLCAEYALFTLVSDSLRDLVEWTTSTRMLVAPLLYLTSRVLVPKLAGTSIAAARVGGVVAAAVVVRHPGIVDATVGGTHGYLALTWIALAVLCLGMATTRRAPIALCIAGAAVPMAMMNHPFAAFAAVAALLLTPALVRSTGWVGVLVALVPAAVVAGPRIPPLEGAMGTAMAWESLISSDLPFGVLIETTLEALNRAPNYMLAAGGVVLVVLAVRTPAGVDRRLSRSWAIAALAPVVVIPAMAVTVRYVRPYHVELVSPLYGVGLAAGVAFGVDRAVRRSAWWGLVLAPVLALGVAVVVSRPFGVTAPMCEPWASADRAGGATRIQETILADLADLPPNTRVMTSNLQLGGDQKDNVQPATLGMLTAGFDPDRMICCPFGEDVAWYWILGTDGDLAELDSIAALDGVDQLLGPPVLEERLITARTPAARYRLREHVCGLPRRTWTGHFPTWLSLMSRALERTFPVPPDPLDCGSANVAPLTDEPGPLGELAEFLSMVEEEGFAWIRRPAEPWGPTVLHLSDCDDPLIADAVRYLDHLDDRAAFEHWAVASIMLDPTGANPPCGAAQGGTRGWARTDRLPTLHRDGHELRVYDHQGRRRGTWTGHFDVGNPNSWEIEPLLTAVHGEHLAAVGARDAGVEPAPGEQPPSDVSEPE